MAVSQPSAAPFGVNRTTLHGLGMVGMALLLLLLSNPLEFAVKGIIPGAASLVDPSTSRAIYANTHLQVMLKVGVLSAFALLLALKWRTALRLPLHAPLLCVFFLYVLTSVRWSETPGNSINDVVYLATALFAGGALICHFNARDAARVFGYAGLAIAVASLLTILFAPIYGVHNSAEASQGGHAGAWRGVYTHKNILGQMCATFFTIYLFKGREIFGSRWLQIFAAGLTLLLALKSRSASAFVLLAICCGGYLFLFVLRGVMRLVAVTVLPVIGLLAFTLRGAMLGLLGRGADLSGRTEIWDAAGRMIIAKPILGYGYGSATMGGLVPYIIQRFKAQNTHNGYIDLALATGALGSSLFYAALIWAVARAAIPAQNDPGRRLLVQVLSVFMLGWIGAAFSEVTLRPNMPMGALGFVVVVLLSCLPGAAAGRGVPASFSTELKHSPRPA